MNRLLILLAAAITMVGCEKSGSGKSAPLSAQEIQGKALLTQHCTRCHSTIENQVIIGPSFAGIAARAASADPGVSAAEYIENAILNPGDNVVEGYAEAMPTTFGKDLTGEQLDAIVAYLLTL